MSQRALLQTCNHLKLNISKTGWTSLGLQCFNMNAAVKKLQILKHRCFTNKFNPAASEKSAQFQIGNWDECQQFGISANGKYGHNLQLCFWVMMLNNKQKNVFVENFDVTMKLTFDLSSCYIFVWNVTIQTLQLRPKTCFVRLPYRHDQLWLVLENMWHQQSFNHINPVRRAHGKHKKWKT